MGGAYSTWGPPATLTTARFRTTMFRRNSPETETDVHLAPKREEDEEGRRDHSAV